MAHLVLANEDKDNLKEEVEEVLKQIKGHKSFFIKEEESISNLMKEAEKNKALSRKLQKFIESIKPQLKNSMDMIESKYKKTKHKIKKCKI
ncbi:hypothetical protein Ciccas_008041 [Cichlidogyrus casuarinus]|uniref:Uncharacterized protein n=1 Tax=Cichlidogyrus casuarinus TaxID=1844966 RepID=A0ABD2Q1K0_9PLAT